MQTLILITISVSAFIATNLDDIILLASFFSSRAFSNRSVVLGQYLGFSTLILISIMASFINLILPPSLISLMGFLPIFIGIKNLLDLKNNQQEYFKEPESYYGKSSGAFTIFKVALVTMANGGDNLGVYIPLLANVNTGDKVSITIIFLILTGIWCFLSYKLVNNRFIAPKILNYGHLILPFVLISIGMIILYTGGAISILANIF